MTSEKLARRRRATESRTSPGHETARGQRADAAPVWHAWSALRSRFLLRALDAIVTADPDGALAGMPRGRGTSNFHRMQRLVRATHGFLPGVVGWITKSLHRQRVVPFRERVGEVVGFGAGSTVYALRGRGDGEEPELVLKIFRNSLGRPLPTLLEHAALLRGRYRRVSGWYSGMSIAVPVEYVILHSPLLDQPAVAGLQPFVSGEKHDFFELVETGGWREMVRRHRTLREQFRLFVERTLAVYDTEDVCLDLVGRDNLLVVVRDGRPRLKVIDYGVLDLAEQRRTAPWRAEAATERVMSLQRLLEESYSCVAQSGGETSEED